MALPKLNEEINFVESKLPSGKSIGVRGWKVKEEKELLFALEMEQELEKNKIKHIINFLKKCVEDKSKFDSISENDVKKVCLDIRRLSKGDEIEYNYNCPKCGHNFFDQVNIAKDQEVKPFIQNPITINEKLVLTFKDLDWQTSEKLFDQFGESDLKYTFKYIVNSIDSLTINGKTYTEFTPEEVEDFIDDLSSDDLKKVYEEFDKCVSSVDLKRTVTCFKCREEIEVQFGELLSFLVL